MSFWSENYSFIKEVYDTRVNKMTEWMDQVEIAITKVMATKVRILYITIFIQFFQVKPLAKVFYDASLWD